MVASMRSIECARWHSEQTAGNARTSVRCYSNNYGRRLAEAHVYQCDLAVSTSAIAPRLLAPKDVCGCYSGVAVHLLNILDSVHSAIWEAI